MPIDQQKLNKEYIFKGRGVAGELLPGLDQVAPIEAKLKARPSRVRWLALAVFVACAVIAVAGGGPLFFLLGIVAPLGLVIYSAFLGATPILHDRVEVLRGALNLLSQDAGSKGRFEVQLRLRANKGQISEGPDPRLSGGKQILFRDPWLTLSGRLSDGTSISESYVDLIRQRTKKNPRGKTKKKERRMCLIRVHLDYNTAIYGDASIASSRLKNRFRLPAGAQLKAFNPSAKSLDIKAVIRGDLTAATLHAVNEAILLGAYRILNLARRRVIAAGGAE